MGAQGRAQAGLTSDGQHLGGGTGTAGDLPDTSGHDTLGVADDGQGDFWQYRFIEFANAHDGCIASRGDRENIAHHAAVAVIGGNADGRAAGGDAGNADHAAGHRDCRYVRVVGRRAIAQCVVVAVGEDAADIHANAVASSDHLVGNAINHRRRVVGRHGINRDRENIAHHAAVAVIGGNADGRAAGGNATDADHAAGHRDCRYVRVVGRRAIAQCVVVAVREGGADIHAGHGIHSDRLVGNFSDHRRCVVGGSGSDADAENISHRLAIRIAGCDADGRAAGGDATDADHAAGHRDCRYVRVIGHRAIGECVVVAVREGAADIHAGHGIHSDRLVGNFSGHRRCVVGGSGSDADADAENISHRLAIRITRCDADGRAAGSNAGNGNRVAGHRDCRYVRVIGRRAIGECVVVAVREGGADIHAGHGIHSDRLVGNGRDHRRRVVGGSGSDADAENISHRLAIRITRCDADVGTAGGNAGNGNRVADDADCRHSGVVGHHAVAQCVVVAVREGAADINRNAVANRDVLVGNFSNHGRCVVGGSGSDADHKGVADTTAVAIIGGNADVGTAGGNAGDADDVTADADAGGGVVVGHHAVAECVVVAVREGGADINRNAVVNSDVLVGNFAGYRRRVVGAVVVVGGHRHSIDRQTAVVAVAAAGAVADSDRLIKGVGIVFATDGHGLCRVPVSRGKDQCVTDGHDTRVAGGGGDGDASGRLAVEDDGVGRGTGLGHGKHRRCHRHAGGVVVVGGHCHCGVDAVVAAAYGSVHDVEGLVCRIAVVNTGDGDGLYGVPVAGGEGQHGRADGRCTGVAAGGEKDHLSARLGVEHDGVGLAAGFTHADRVGGEAQTRGVIVGGGHCHAAGDAAVAAAAGGMGDVEGLVCTIVIVDTGDGDGLCRAKVAGGEGQCATDGRRIGIAAGRGDGDVVGWGGVEHHGVGLAAGLSHADRVGGEAQTRGVIVGGGHAHGAGDSVVAAASGCVADVEGL